jgi:serine/threonine-protein kinase RsbW
VTTETPQLRLLLAAAPENVVVARQAITGLCEGLGFPSRSTDDVRLAVTEACTNVVIHAYEDEETGDLEVDASIADRRLTVVIRDNGRGIVPRPDSPGLGLGLPLIATLAETLELGKDKGDNTEVRMTFRLDEDEDEDEDEA